MPRLLAFCLIIIMAALSPLSGWAFDEIDQTDQKRYKSRKSCSGCHLLQRGPDGRLKMIGAELEGVDLRKLNLRAADLRRADLRGVNLAEVNLQDARLKGALLRGANLRQANLRGADLYGADLTGAEMQGADLRGSNFARADLSQALLANTRMEGAVLCRTTMPSGTIRNPDCQWWKPQAAIKTAETPPPRVDEKRQKPNGGDTGFLIRIFGITLNAPGKSGADIN